MKNIKDIEKMRVFSRVSLKSGKTIGFVPTMGALHDGHSSLIRASKRQNDITVVSIYVNPLQFSPKEDLDKYPRDITKDEAIAEKAGADVVFYPSDAAMYPEGFSTYVNVENLTEDLCGASRPGHFRGVTTVVTKLFSIVVPNIAYFGQKDIQQAIVIRRMVRDLGMGVTVKIMPTVREKDGLAMSSRNVYLNETERSDATVLFRAVKKAEELFKEGERSAKAIIAAMSEAVSGVDSSRIDYIKIVDPNDLKCVDTVKDGSIAAVAVYIGKTRLIDNTILGESRG